MHDERTQAFAAVRSLFSPFPVRSGDAGSDVSDTGEDKQSRLRGDHLWGDAVLHPSRVPSGCRHPAEPLCCARSTRASLTLLLHPISHTRERRGRKDGLPGGADGHLSAAICQEISALDCALTKKKTKKGKWQKDPTFCKIFNHVVLRCYVEKKIWQLFPFFPE